MPAGSHAYRLGELRADADAEAAAQAPEFAREETAAEKRLRGAEKQRGDDRRSFWEDLFEEPDPWNYGSPYEQEKYRRQLDLLPERLAGTTLELACAEGRFTEQLSSRVERLIATDISSKALERAKERCAGKDNIEFRQLDLSADSIPEDLDLILCSEVLYYLKDEPELVGVARRLADAVKPGGHILTAHAFLVKDDKARTGFDWENPFGAETIARVFADTEGLQLERSLQTELYRIDLFRRQDERLAVEPRIETASIDAEIELEVARHILWGGAVVRRSEVAGTESRRQMPVLMYHRIADDGPDELARYRVSPDMFRMQMGWLRRNGYHSIGSEQLGWFVTNGHPFVGRPVMISFDDGFQDFADQAWPVLQAHDFTAEMFVVADLVGRSALWDAGIGGAAPLMDAATIARLASQGMLFGSHLASHRGADGLSTQELAGELLRSRAMMGRWLGNPPRSFAPPFGLTDERLRLLAAECGFRFGFSTENGLVSLGSDPLDLPRIEVRGDWTIDDFVNRMESYL